VGGADVRGAVEVRVGAGGLQDPGVGAGGEPQLIDSHFDQLAGIVVDRADRPDLAVGQAGVEGGFVAVEAAALDFVCPFDPGLDRRRRLARLPQRQVAVTDRGDLDVDVDPVEERSGDPPLVLTDLWGGAPAGMVS